MDKHEHGKHPNTLANLKRGNVFSSTNQPAIYKQPNSTRSAFIRNFADRTPDEVQQLVASGRLTNKELVVVKLIDKAKEGDVQAMNLFLDSTFGKMKEVPQEAEEMPIDYSCLTDDELKIVAEAQMILRKARERANGGIQEAEIIEETKNP